MRILIVLIVLVLFFNTSNSQPNILLIVEKNQIAKIILNNGEEIIGEYNSINEKSIKISDSIYQLSDCKIIKLNYKYFEVNDNIKFKLHKNIKFIKGQILNIYDNNLLINDSIYALSDISLIRKINFSKAAIKYIGGSLIIGGVLIFSSGVSSLASENDVDFSSSLTGLSSIVIGSIPFLIRENKYDIGFDWDAVILSEKKSVLK